MSRLVARVDTRWVGRHPGRAVLPRLTASVLSVVLGLAGVLASPAACRTLCSFTRAEQADCCKRVASGIAAPRCCEGPLRLDGRSAPATIERGGPDVRTSPVVVALAVPASAVAPGVRLQVPHAAGVGPPGRGPLIAQHTSLLL